MSPSRHEEKVTAKFTERRCLEEHRLRGLNGRPYLGCELWQPFSGGVNIRTGWWRRADRRCSCGGETQRQRVMKEKWRTKRETEMGIMAAILAGRVHTAAKYGRHSSGETQIRFSSHTVCLWKEDNNNRVPPPEWQLQQMWEQTRLISLFYMNFQMGCS